MFRSLCPLLLAFVFLPVAARADEPGAKQAALRVATSEEEAEFENRVRPLLARHCFECHGPKKQEASLRLDSGEAIARGSDNGAIIVPGDPAASRLVAALR